MNIESSVGLTRAPREHAWVDKPCNDGDTWQEIDLAKLARDPAFLQVGA